MHKASFCSSSTHSLIFPYAPLTPPCPAGQRHISQSVRFQSWLRSQFLTESAGIFDPESGPAAACVLCSPQLGDQMEDNAARPSGQPPLEGDSSGTVAFLGKGLQRSRKDQPRRQMEGGAVSQGLPRRPVLSSTIHQSHPWYFP